MATKARVPILPCAAVILRKSGLHEAKTQRRRTYAFGSAHAPNFRGEFEEISGTRPRPLRVHLINLPLVALCHHSPPQLHAGRQRSIAGGKFVRH
jgi:hypothetical protein